MKDTLTIMLYRDTKNEDISPTVIKVINDNSLIQKFRQNLRVQIQEEASFIKLWRHL